MYLRLTRLGHHVLIVNTHNQDEIVDQINHFNPDIVHLHWEAYYTLLDRIHCKNVLITGHRHDLPFLRDTQFHSGNYKIIALSPEIKNQYIEAGCDPSKLIVIPNAVDEGLFTTYPYCMYPNRSAYVGLIDERKRQHMYTKITSLYFIGEIKCSKFIKSDRYLGEWSKQMLYSFLTCFANLVLLSSFECHPLVVCEALMSGLGVVVSESASGNLDRSKPWVTVIPNDQLDNIPYVEDAIRENRKQSIIHRHEIRKYALETFSWNVRIPEIVRTYETILAEQS
jgi:glycosyltransferase involved in cell wall biosynthesis